MKYIGFDLGDGESAVASYEKDSAIEPKICPVYGQNSFISAVGVKGSEVLIGEQAYTDTPSDGLSVRFKSRFTTDFLNKDLSLFYDAVLKALQSSGCFHPGSDNALIVGCPAGWNQSERKRYQDVLSRMNGIKPRIVSESRAAFLYAKYAKTVALDIDILNESALVIDFGSSTLDYAYIVNGHETGIGTFGETLLGSGLLDAALLQRSIQKSRDAAQISSVLNESHSWYSYCEIEARHIKEEFFILLLTDKSPSVRRPIKIYYDDIQKFTIELNNKEIQSLIHMPMAELNGKSFYDALQTSLNNAKKITENCPPKIVLIAGGASRMPFFADLCTAVFPDAVLVKCPEPEFSIAKGLAYAGWVDDNLEAFRKEIAEQFSTETITNVLATHMNSLISNISSILTTLILNRIAVPALEEWQRGETDTLNSVQNNIIERSMDILQSEVTQQALQPAVQKWLLTISEELQNRVDIICDRYNVPRQEMVLHLNYVGINRLDLNANQLLDVSVWNNIIGIIVSIVCGALCGGSNIALIATGPLGFIAGAAIGIVAAALGRNVISNVLLNLHIPVLLRRVDFKKSLQSEKTVRNMYETIRKYLSTESSGFSEKIYRQFSGSFSDYIRQTANAAEIPIE